MKTRRKQHEYLISLYTTRSKIALVSGILMIICTLVVIAHALEDYTGEEESNLHYFTVQSNILAAIGAAFMIPYAVEGIRKKRFALPHWLVLFQYAGASCVAITLVTAMTIILPTQGLMAVQGMNFWLHLITPLCTVVLFLCVETGVCLERRDVFIALIPYWIYMVIYFINVVLVGRWTDFYMTMAFWPAWVSVVLMLALGTAVAFTLRYIHNKRAAESTERLTRTWQDDMSPVELRVEAFGLGRYMGVHCDHHDLVIPVDIFEMMAKKYDVTLGELSKAFVKGAMDAIREREGKQKRTDGR